MAVKIQITINPWWSRCICQKYIITILSNLIEKAINFTNDDNARLNMKNLLFFDPLQLFSMMQYVMLKYGD